MKFYLNILAILVLFTYSFSNSKINYLEPVPGAKLVNIYNNIIIGFEKRGNLNKADILNNMSVTGSKSGVHNGTVTVCIDRMKILFQPSVPFEYGERVTIRLFGNLKKSVSTGKKEFEYSFDTSPQKVPWNPMSGMDGDLDPHQNGLFDAPPQLTVTVNNNPSDGSIFLGTFTAPSYLIITNKNGITYWYSQSNSYSFDFKKQPNGNLTYYKQGDYKHYEMDMNYNIIDTFFCGNGYDTDGHDLRLLGNGHAYVMAYDPEIIDMSQIVPGGNPNATVIGLIIQEIDENKNVVFQWRSWDHIPITDALHENLLAANIDYVHGNAIEIDNDSNIMISSRHLDEITKINRSTGSIIWRMGGRQNQFTFTNDTLRFTYQHAVRRISNGNITIFDNGNFHAPPFTRAIEYSINESAKTATLVWEYRHTPGIFSSYLGYVQRLSTGNTLIGWGGANPSVTEVTPSGTVVFEMTFPPHIYSYRAYKFDWGNPVPVNNENRKIPSSFRLYQNYPNPFNPSTIINYDVPKASYVKLTVFDINGKELKEIVSANMQPGSYSATFDASGFSSGLYFYRLSAGDIISTRKMIFIK